MFCCAVVRVNELLKLIQPSVFHDCPDGPLEDLQEIKLAYTCDDGQLRLDDYLSCYQPYWQIKCDDSRRLINS